MGPLYYITIQIIYIYIRIKWPYPSNSTVMSRWIPLLPGPGQYVLPTSFKEERRSRGFSPWWTLGFRQQINNMEFKQCHDFFVFLPVRKSGFTVIWFDHLDSWSTGRYSKFMVVGHETGHISRTDRIASTGFRWSGKPARNLRAGHATRPSIPLVEKSRRKQHRLLQ